MSVECEIFCNDGLPVRFLKIKKTDGALLEAFEAYRLYVRRPQTPARRAQLAGWRDRSERFLDRVCCIGSWSFVARLLYS